MPASCAAARAESTGSITASALAGAIGASLRIRSRMVSPGTYSITRNNVPWSSPVSKTETTFWWASRAAERASRWKRRTNSSSSASPSCITFTATVRSSRRSVAS